MRSVALPGGPGEHFIDALARESQFVLSATPPSPELMSIEVRLDVEPLLALELPLDGGDDASRGDDSSGCGLALRPGGTLGGARWARAGCWLARLARSQSSVK